MGAYRGHELAYALMERENGVTRRRIILLVAGGVVLLAVAFAGWQGGVRGGRGAVSSGSSLTRLLRKQIAVHPAARRRGSPELAATPPDLLRLESTPFWPSDLMTKDNRRRSGPPIRERAYADTILLWLSPTDRRRHHCGSAR